MAVRNQRKIKNVSASMAEQLEELIQPGAARRTRAKPIDKHVDRASKSNKESSRLDSPEQTQEVSMNENEIPEVDQALEDALVAMQGRVVAEYPKYVPDKERLRERCKAMIAEVIVSMLMAPEEERGEDTMRAKVIELLEEELMREAKAQSDSAVTATAVTTTEDAASEEQPAEEALQGEASQEDASTVSTISTDFEEIVEMIHAQGYRGVEQGTLVGFKEVCVSKEGNEYRVVPVFEDAIGLQKTDMHPFYLKGGVLALEEKELTKYDYIGNQHLV